MDAKAFSSFIYLNEYCWTNIKLFKGLLNDFFPEEENKSYRNLILLCCEENIPKDLEKFDNASTNRCVHKLCNASGCSKEKAEEIIHLWKAALSTFETQIVINSSPIHYLPTLSRSSIIFSDFVRNTPEVRLIHCVFGFGSDEDIDTARFEWTPDGYIFYGGPHDMSNSYRYSAPIEVLFETPTDNDAYVVIKQHGIDMIRELCGYSFSDLALIFGTESACKIKADLMQKGFSLNENARNYLSMYPEHIRTEAERDADAFKLYLDVILLYCDWFTQYQDFLYSEHCDLKLFYEYETSYSPYLSEYKESNDLNFILKMLWDVFKSMSENIFALIDEADAIGESNDNVSDSEKTIILAERVMTVYLDWIKFSNFLDILEIDYPDIIDNKVSDVLEAFYAFEHQCSDICQNWDIVRDENDVVPSLKPIITSIIDAEKSIVSGTIIWINTIKEKNESADIGELELSIRSHNILKRANIQTIGELTKMTESELRKVRNMGRGDVAEIIRQLTEKGFHLKEE